MWQIYKCTVYQDIDNTYNIYSTYLESVTCFVKHILHIAIF